MIFGGGTQRRKERKGFGPHLAGTDARLERPPTIDALDCHAKGAKSREDFYSHIAERLQNNFAKLCGFA